MFIRYALLSFIALLLSACGGSSDSTQESPPPVVVTPAPAPIIYTGIFLDSFVENLSYATASSTGMTNVMGEFSYQLNEQVTFSIGSIAFLPIEAEAIITPLTIFDTQDINNIAVVNMLRLLQSLDIDGNADNGITISDTAHELANGLTVNFSDTDFDSQVANLVAMSGALNQQLISAESAIAHFQQTLSEQDISVCAKTHSKIGQTGFFSTFAHNVAGMATIIDDCTIEITQFDYEVVARTYIFMRHKIISIRPKMLLQ